MTNLAPITVYPVHTGTFNETGDLGRRLLSDFRFATLLGRQVNVLFVCGCIKHLAAHCCLFLDTITTNIQRCALPTDCLPSVIKEK